MPTGADNVTISHNDDDNGQMRHRPQPISRRDPEKKRRRTTYKRSEHTSQDPSPLEDDEYGGVIDPMLVTQPVKRLVHKSLGNAWSIRPDHQMWFIFDSHSPARHFKRGTLRQAGAQPPMYDPERFGELTDTDIDPPGWMPFAPAIHRYTLQTRDQVGCPNRLLGASIV